MGWCTAPPGACGAATLWDAFGTATAAITKRIQRRRTTPSPQSAILCIARQPPPAPRTNSPPMTRCPRRSPRLSRRPRRTRSSAPSDTISSGRRPTPTVGEVAVVQWQAAGLLKPSGDQAARRHARPRSSFASWVPSSPTIRNRSDRLSRRLSGSGGPAAAHHRLCANASTASGAMRTVLRTRTCARAPRAQSLYTVPSQTRSRRATSATESRAPGGTPTCLSYLGGASSGSKIGAKSFELVPNPGERLDADVSRSWVFLDGCKPPPPPAISSSVFGRSKRALAGVRPATL